MKKAKELINGVKSTYTTAMFNEIRKQKIRNLCNYVKDTIIHFFFRWFISPNPELYKKDNKIVLDNMRKAKELINGG